MPSSLEKQKPAAPSMYRVTKLRGLNLYQVHNTKTGHVHSYGTARDKAMRQARLLEMLHFK